MANFYLCKASEIWSYFSAVSGSAADDYEPDWLCDARAGRPVHAGGSSGSWSITFPASGEVGLVALCHSTASGSASVSGGVSATITAGALQDDGIRLNGFATVTPASAGSCSVSASASGDLIVGEFIAAKYRSLSLPVYTNDSRNFRDFTRAIDMDLSSIPPYDPGLAGRQWECGFVLSASDKQILEDAFLAQRNGTRPTLVVPDSSVNDAWLCFLSAPQSSVAGSHHWNVSVTMTEVPRVRWP